MSRYILSIDQGTTSTRSMLFTPQGKAIATAQQTFTQYYPAANQVEHDPQEIIDSVINTLQQVIKKANIAPEQIHAIGITNQRETTVVWDKNTGTPIHKAIVWQDRRTANICDKLKQQGLSQTIQQKTGLLIDPYFSATKIQWLLDTYDPDRTKANKGELLFGTIDTYILWHLTHGQHFATDVTNASRTLLFNIHTQQWDEELLALFNIPHTMLADVRDCDALFGTLHTDICGRAIPIHGIAGDQHAALIGQACFHSGMLKSTYGTGSFMMLNTGDTPYLSQHQLLTTIAYRINSTTHYAIEGSIFMAGAIIQWLRDNLGLIKQASETEALAQQADPDSQVLIVPAFVGLGAPYWDANALASISGLGRGSGKAEIVAAALESIAFQTRDLIDAMQSDTQTTIKQLRIDGGMVTNHWFTQCLANICNTQIEITQTPETTALGAAYLAALGSGLLNSTDTITQHWQPAATFTPDHQHEKLNNKYHLWQQAVRKVLTTKDKGLH